VKDRWQEVERIYHLTLEKEASERSAFLVQACAGDQTLRREVESLLTYEHDAEGFMEAPAIEVAARIMAGEHAPIRAGDRFNQKNMRHAAQDTVQPLPLLHGKRQ